MSFSLNFATTNTTTGTTSIQWQTGWIDEDRPRLEGTGEPEFSTCVELERYPLVIWDTNCYYSDLGVSPRATKRELREAYRRLHGERSVRLTYVLKQLLNDTARRAYDATPIGSMFRDDAVNEWLHREFKRRLADMQQHLNNTFGLDFDERDAYEALRDQGEDLGFTPVDEVVDDAVEKESLDDVTRAPEDASASEPPWMFSYYVWRSSCRDIAKLRRWQEALLRIFAEHRRSVRLAIGFYGGEMELPWKVERVGTRTVMFLHHSIEPNDAIARAAASRVVTDPPASKGAP